MNLKNIGVIAVAGASLLFASCAKAITYEEAVQFVKDHYSTGEASKNTIKQIYEFKGATNDEETKKLLIEIAKAAGYELDNNLYAKIEKQETIGISKLKPEDVLKGNVFTYEVKGSELTIKTVSKADTPEATGEMKLSSTYNSEGFLYKIYEKMNAKQDKYSYSAELTTTYFF